MGEVAADDGENGQNTMRAPTPPADVQKYEKTHVGMSSFVTMRLLWIDYSLR